MPKANSWHSVSEPHHHDNTECGPATNKRADKRLSPRFVKMRIAHFFIDTASA
jgi:hypothetical protein